MEAHMAFRQSHTPYFSASARFSALRFPLAVLVYDVRSIATSPASPDETLGVVVGGAALKVPMPDGTAFVRKSFQHLARSICAHQRRNSRVTNGILSELLRMNLHINMHASIPVGCSVCLLDAPAHLAGVWTLDKAYYCCLSTGEMLY